VALGGGSVIDFAKVATSFAGKALPENLETILGERHEDIPQRTVPLIAVPTTAGTGSETTPYAVLTGRNNRKLFARSPNLYPDMGIVCAQFYETVPQHIIREVALDGMTHALEALWSKTATPVSEMFALGAMERFHRSVKPYYERSDDISLASDVAVAATFAGIAFAHAYTSICHALSFPLAERLHLSHGHCCALTAAQTARFNADYETPGLLRLCEILGLRGLQELPQYLLEFRSGLDDSEILSDFGITANDVPLIASQARSTMISNNAKVASPADIERILLDAIGQPNLSRSKARSSL